MERQEELIKKYIKKGISPKVIALEFGVPIEVVEKYKEELEQERVKQATARPLKATNPSSYLKMQVMREKYEKLLLGQTKKDNETATNQGSQTVKKKKLSPEELKKAEEVISSIEQKMKELDEATTSGRRTKGIIDSILKEASELQLYEPLPFEMAVRFQKIITPLSTSKMPYKDSELNQLVRNAKIGAANKVIRAIEIIADEATSIEELQEAYRKLLETENKNKVAASSLKSRIQKKISDLQMKKAMDKIKNIPQNLSDMIERLLNGEIDLQEANKIIEEEAKQRVVSRPQSKFAITEEQEKGQISIQIRTAIMENPDKYNIKNPEEAISNIHQLCGGQQGEAIRAIVTNLIGKKHFETAKRICSKFSGKDENGTLTIYIRRLQEDIRNAEISEMVLRGLNMTGTLEEQGAYYEGIETGLKRGNVNPRSIVLGKSIDGSRTITLADIWLPEEKNKKGMKR